MGRYLFFISYVGSKYRGLQQQAIQEVDRGIQTVTGILKEALGCLRPKNEIRLVTSSRTDSGVHAMCNTVHCDLEPGERSPIQEYSAAIMCHTVNCYMKKNHHDIRVLRVLRVNDDFHVRFHAIGRTYCYKMSRLRHRYNDVILHPVLPHSALDVSRCVSVSMECDMQRLAEGAQILSGTHDFSAFASSVKPYQNPVKTMEIKVHPGVTMDTYLPESLRQFDYYDVTFHAKSFMNKQVRMMMGALVAYGRGLLTSSRMEEMLTRPENYRIVDGMPRLYHCQPPSGLYLLNVHYNPEDLVYDPSRVMWNRLEKANVGQTT